MLWIGPEPHPGGRTVEGKLTTAVKSCWLHSFLIYLSPFSLTQSCFHLFGGHYIILSYMNFLEIYHILFTKNMVRKPSSLVIIKKGSYPNVINWLQSRNRVKRNQMCMTALKLIITTMSDWWKEVWKSERTQVDKDWIHLLNLLNLLLLLSAHPLEGCYTDQYIQFGIRRCPSWTLPIYTGLWPPWLG